MLAYNCAFEYTPHDDFADGRCVCNNRRGEQVSESDRSNVDGEDDQDVYEAAGVPASQESEPAVHYSAFCRTGSCQFMYQMH